MKKKLISVLGSVRFWLTLVGAVVFYLVSTNVISKEIGDAILGFLGISVVTRTVDKFR